MTDDPRRTECVRAGCGHSSDVHVLRVDPRERISVTESAICFPCEVCDCSSMVRSTENYAALMQWGQR